MQKILDKLTAILEKLLPEVITKHIRKFITVQFVLFIIIGVINTFNTAVIATVFDILKKNFFDNIEFISKYNITFVVGYVLSMVISFFLNTYITFKEKPTLKKFITFPVSYIPNFLIQYITVAVFKLLGFNATVAYLIAAVVGIPVTFITMKIIYDN